MDTIFRDAGMFREALMLTRERTGFSERLIEKDYFCTQLLEYFAEANPELIFKGGTCLAKAHGDFYRLSEDLDFVVSTPADTPRSQRSREAAASKKAVAELPERLPHFRVLEALTGANNSTQYNALLGYSSLASSAGETVKVEIGLREPLLLPSIDAAVGTLLLDPISRAPRLKPVRARCISLVEAFAEKFRAALSRREVAVRDFFDIDYAVRRLGLQTDEANLIAMVRQKLTVPGNEPWDVSNERLEELRRQLQPQLQPVLRARDFAEFDLERAFDLVVDMAARVA